MSDDEEFYNEELNDEADIYDEEGQEELEEDDEISPVEEAFMRGYKTAGIKKKLNLSKKKNRD